jgi:amidophosphoribosyltransferase
MAAEAREKCAVAGIIATDPELVSSHLLRESLFAMQHRGAEASGMVSQLNDGSMEDRRELGMVRDVYSSEDLQRLAGSIAIGHNRYSTSGSKLKHPQPFIDAPIGFAFGHNGNLTVTERLETFLTKHNIHPSHANDSEMMGLAIAQYVRNGQDLPNAIELAYPLFRGAFSCLAMHDGMMVAFRDRKGIRPLALGKLDGGYAVASETCGLDIINAAYEREVAPGEMVIITESGIESRQVDAGDTKLDLFEYVYFARHDSQLYGQRVNEVRRRFGEQLAEMHPPAVDNLDNVVVVPVPDTSIPAAEGYAEKLGLSHRQAIIKNRFIGRTFMQTSDTNRKEHLRLKHNVIPEAIRGKDVIIIDDSIVRLNTMPVIVQLVKEAKARSVTVLIASPPVRFPDYYGIDTPKQS